MLQACCPFSILGVGSPINESESTFQHRINRGLPYMATTVEKPKRKKNYVNNKDMMIEIHKSIEQDKLTDTLAKMFMLLSKRYSSRGNFSGYTYRDDMEAYALYMVCRTWKSFNPEKSNNPFAFFTQCIKHSFFQFLNKEKRQRDIRDELLVNSGMNPSNTYITTYEDEQQQKKDNLNGPVIDVDVQEFVDSMEAENPPEVASNG